MYQTDKAALIAGVLAGLSGLLAFLLLHALWMEAAMRQASLNQS